MSKKYARDKTTKYLKTIIHGFSVGGLGEVYNACVGHEQSCDVLGTIKDRSKFDDRYYSFYKELSKNKTKQAGVDFFNLKTLLDFENTSYKDKILSCLTCSITSLFGAISYDNLSKNILVLGITGGLLNSFAKSIITGHTHGTDFVFGMISSMVGVQIMRDTKELASEDDILHPEIL